MKERKPNRYWKSLDDALAEARKITKEHGFKTLPGKSKLLEFGYSALVSGIYKWHGGMHNFRKLLREEQKQREPNTWRDREFAIRYARAVIRKHKLKTLPTDDELRQLGYNSLAGAIPKYHEGYTEFRKALGEKPLKVKNGSLKDKEYVIQKLHEIMEKYNLKEIPSDNKLKKLGYSSIGFAITEYHGGMHKIRKLLGQKQKERQKGIWKRLDYTLQQAKEMMEEHGFETLPGGYTLSKRGYSSLSSAIEKYHDGFPKFRQLLNKALGIKTKKQELTDLLRGYARQ